MSEYTNKDFEVLMSLIRCTPKDIGVKFADEILGSKAHFDRLNRVELCHELKVAVAKRFNTVTTVGYEALMITRALRLEKLSIPVGAKVFIVENFVLCRDQDFDKIVESFATVFNSKRED